VVILLRAVVASYRVIPAIFIKPVSPSGHGVQHETRWEKTVNTAMPTICLMQFGLFFSVGFVRHVLNGAFLTGVSSRQLRGTTSNFEDFALVLHLWKCL